MKLPNQPEGPGVAELEKFMDTVYGGAAIMSGLPQLALDSLQISAQVPLMRYKPEGKELPPPAITLRGYVYLYKFSDNSDKVYSDLVDWSNGTLSIYDGMLHAEYSAKYEVPEFGRLRVYLSVNVTIPDDVIELLRGMGMLKTTSNMTESHAVVCNAL